jgi:hypothetical protein
MDWRCGSSSRVPALQEQNPEFNKSQSHQKKERKKRSKGKRQDEKAEEAGEDNSSSSFTLKKRRGQKLEEDRRCEANRRPLEADYLKACLSADEGRAQERQSAQLQRKVMNLACLPSQGS